MKRNVIKLFVLGLLLCGLCYSYSLKKSGNASLNMSELTIRNMEALANDEDFNLDDFNDNCYWYQDKDCYYWIVSPDGNTVWWHSNFEERF